VEQGKESNSKKIKVITYDILRLADDCRYHFRLANFNVVAYVKKYGN